MCVECVQHVHFEAYSVFNSCALLLRLRRTCRRTHGLQEPQRLVDLGGLASLVPLQLLAHGVGNGIDCALGGTGVQERQAESTRQHILGYALYIYISDPFLC